jgi:periplasmic divalent cation tolerance protein
VKAGWSMSEFVVVLCTTALAEADRLAKTLVEERLAACVNIAPVRSYYIWEVKLNEDKEELMIIKTKKVMVERLQARILELHSYKVPEIIVLSIIEGYPPYLSWMAESVG